MHKQPQAYIQIQYCTNCSTHKWCTHHNQEKYQEIFLDLQFVLRKNFDNVHIVGNPVPNGYAPVKPTENKYYDRKSNKYVIFPAIGAFEVKCNGQLIFSKKEKNSWPHIPDLISQIENIAGEGKLDQKQIVQLRKSRIQKDVDSESVHTVPNSKKPLQSLDRNSTFYPKNKNNEEFTLTDHFKRYKMNKKTDVNSVFTGSDKSQGRISKITAEDLKSLNKKTWGNEENLPNFIKNKAYIQENNIGKKQMLVNLSSIEEQHDLNKKNIQTRNSKNSIKRISKLGDELNKFEKRFSRFQKKVQQVNIRRMEFQKLEPQKQNYKYKEESVYNPQKLSPRKSDILKFSTINRVSEINKKYNAMDILKQIKDNKNKKIQDYLNATSQQKNQKLSQIYGPYVFKKKYESGSKSPIKKYRNSNNSQFQKINRSDMPNIKQIIKKKKIKQFKSNRKQQSSQSQSQDYSSLDSRIYGSQDSNVEIQVSPQMVQKHKKQNQSKERFRSLKNRQKHNSNKVIPKKMIRDSEMKLNKNQTANNFYRKQKKSPSPSKTHVMNNTNEKNHFSIKKIRQRAQKHTQQQSISKMLKTDNMPSSSINDKQNLSHYKNNKDIKHISQKSSFEPKLQEQRLKQIYGDRNQNYQQWRTDIKNTKKLKKSKIPFRKNQKMIGNQLQKQKKEKELMNKYKYRKYQGEQQQQQCMETQENINENSTVRVQISNRQQDERMKLIKQTQRQRQSQSDQNLSQNNNNNTKKNMKNKKNIKYNNNNNRKIDKIKQDYIVNQQKKKKENNKINGKKDKKKQKHLIKQRTKYISQQQQQLHNMNTKQHNIQSQQENIRNKQENIQSIQENIKSILNKQKISSNSQAPIMKSKRDQFQNQQAILSKKQENKCNNQYKQKIFKQQGQSSKNLQYKSNHAQQQQQQQQIPIIIKKNKNNSNSKSNRNSKSNSNSKRKSKNQISQKQAISKNKMKKVDQQMSQKSQLQSQTQSQLQDSAINADISENQSKVTLSRFNQSPSIISKKSPSKQISKNRKSSVQSQSDKSPSKKSPSKKSPSKKSASKKSASKKSPIKKSPIKKSESKKSPIKKSPIKKSESKKSAKKSNKKGQKQKKKKKKVNKLNKSLESESEQCSLSGQQVQNYRIYDKSRVSKYMGDNQTIQQTSQNNETPSISHNNLNHQNQQSNTHQYQQNNKEQEIKSNINRQSSKKQQKKSIIQSNNVQTESKPRKIYGIDQITPETCDKQTQTDNKVTKYVQTSDLSEQQLDDLKQTHKKKQIKNKKQRQSIDTLSEADSHSQQMIQKQSISKLSLHDKNNTKINTKSKSKSNKKDELMEKSYINKYTKAKITKQLFGTVYSQSVKQAQCIINDDNQFIQNHVSMQTQNNYMPISQIMKKRVKTLQQQNKKWSMFDNSSIQAEKIIDRSNSFAQVLKVIHILASKNQFLILRLFENSQKLTKHNKYGVWLCDNFKWKCYIVDDMVQVDKSRNPFNFDHTGNQYWPIILEKALLILFGSQQNLKAATLGQIFHALTGCNNLSFRVKEDINKNTQLLKFIANSERKNYILVASKRSYNSINQCIQEQNKSSLYYILSQKSINENQTLIRMKKQNSDAFWVKIQKFVIDFYQVDIMQLRVNHNFFTTDLQETTSGKFQIYELHFQETGFGSISVCSNRGNSNFKVYLYREQQDSVMKLVGQAKEKNKKNLYFDCNFDQSKYVLFIEMSSNLGRLAYAGESKPIISPKQSIKGDNLKNDFTQYVPVQSLPKRRQSQMPKFMTATMSGFQPSQKDNQSIIEFDKVSKASRISRQSNNTSVFKKDYIKKQFIEFLMENGI